MSLPLVKNVMIVVSATVCYQLSALRSVVHGLVRDDFIVNLGSLLHSYSGPEWILPSLDFT